MYTSSILKNHTNTMNTHIVNIPIVTLNIYTVIAPNITVYIHALNTPIVTICICSFTQICIHVSKYQI